MSDEEITPTTTEPSCASEADRRSFMARALIGVAGALTAAAAAGPLGMLLNPLLKPSPARAATWRFVGRVAHFRQGAESERVMLKADVQDGWATRRNTPLGPVLVRRTTQDTFKVFSGVCPHLGCSVGVDKGKNRFICPCHKSAFALDGERLELGGAANPSPRSLDPLNWRIVDGKLEVEWVRYETGVAERLPVG